MVDLGMVLQFRLCSFLDSAEVAAIRTVSKAVRSFVETEPANSFQFTFGVRLHLPLFLQESHLLWFINRQRGDALLGEFNASSQYENWRRIGCLDQPQDFWYYPDVQDNPDVQVLQPAAPRFPRSLELTRGFWYHPDVQALRTAAIRLDSVSLLLRIAAKAPGVCGVEWNGDGTSQTPLEYFKDPNSDGTAQFMHNTWIFIEQAHFLKDGPWEPGGRQDALDQSNEVFCRIGGLAHWFCQSNELFYSTVHRVLWEYMAALRKRQKRHFRGYCNT
jgi:hypothetical protein